MVSGAQHIPSPRWCGYVVDITLICLIPRGSTVSKRGAEAKQSVGPSPTTKEKRRKKANRLSLSY